MMQGHQRIQDIIAALTDSSHIDHEHRTKTLNTALKTLWNQRYLRRINWWNLMPPDDLASKINLEEEKKIQGEKMTTSATLTSKALKEAGEASRKRIAELNKEKRTEGSLKRKATDKIDIQTFRKKRRFEDDDEEEKDKELRSDFDVRTFCARLMLGNYYPGGGPFKIR
jgi:hypothetical protein